MTFSIQAGTCECCRREVEQAKFYALEGLCCACWKAAEKEIQSTAVDPPSHFTERDEP